MSDFINMDLEGADSFGVIISTQDPAIRKENVEMFAKQVLQDQNIENHPDFLLLESTNNSIGIDDIKKLISKIQYKPYRAKKKIAVIENAEKLTDEAQNAFLKTLEDIPPRTIIVLSTNNYSYMLPTIISRCKVYEIHSKEEIEKKFNITEILGSDLVQKFKVVEEIIKIKDTKEKRESAMILIKLLTEFYRKQLQGDVQNTNYSDNLKLLQNTMTSISKNVNLRLALENLMINLK